MHRPLPWYRRWWFYLLALATCLTVGLIGRKEYANWRTRGELEQELAKLSQTEPHWSLRRWYESYTPPTDDENLAVAALKLQVRYAGESPAFLKVFENRDAFPGNPLNAEQVKELRTTLAGMGDLRNEIRQLLRLKTGHFPPLDLDDPRTKLIQLGFNSQQQIRRAAYLLSYQAELWAHEGKADDALDACRAMLHLAHAFDNDPYLISQLIAMGCQGDAISTMQRVLAQCEPSETALRTLQEALWREADISLAERALRADRACLDQVFLEIEQGRYTSEEMRRMVHLGNKPVSSDASFSDYFAAARDWLFSSPFEYLPRERLHMLRFCTEALELIRLQETDLHLRLRGLHERHGQQSRAVREMGKALLRAYESDGTRKNRLRAAAGLLAAERYRLATGKMPTAWNDLVNGHLPRVPTGVFDGQPLLWKTTPTGFRFYSPGPGPKTPVSDITDGARYGVEFWDIKYRRKLSPVPLRKADE